MYVLIASSAKATILLIDEKLMYRVVKVVDSLTTGDFYGQMDLLVLCQPHICTLCI